MNNKPSGLNKLKDFCIERLWFVVLLAPLLVVAVMMTQHFQPAEKKSINRGVAMVVGSVEISAVELAVIVAKPLSELLAMEVYAIAQNNSVAAISNKNSGARHASYNHLSEIKRADANPISVVSYTVVDKLEMQRVRDAS